MTREFLLLWLPVVLLGYLILVCLGRTEWAAWLLAGYLAALSWVL